MLRVVIVVSVVAGVLGAIRQTGSRGHRPSTGVGMRWRWRSPAVGLAAVTVLIYLNQVLFTIYVARVHDGDPSFIARYVPEGWFNLAGGSLIEGLARGFPAPELLAPSVLRVNAFLELPFVVLAYLTVCRWFSTEVYHRALGLVWPIAVFYTATFCLIEWRLYNPYTIDDVVIRLLAGLAVPLAAGYLRTEGASGRTDAWPGLLVFGLSAAGLGAAVLVVYDTALLYNLGDLDTQLAVGVAALAAVALARYLAPRVPDRAAGRTIHTMSRSLGWLLLLGAVPALPTRYGLTFGAPYTAAAGGLVVFTAAAGLGLRDVMGNRPGGLLDLLPKMTATACVGLGCAAVSLLASAEHGETRILIAGAAAIVGAVAAGALIDRWVATPREVRCWESDRRAAARAAVATPARGVSGDV